MTDATFLGSGEARKQGPGSEKDSCRSRPSSSSPMSAPSRTPGEEANKTSSARVAHTPHPPTSSPRQCCCDPHQVSPCATGERDDRAWSLLAPVDDPSVADGLHDDDFLIGIDPIDDSIVASSSGAEPGELTMQGLADPFGGLSEWTVDELDNRGCDFRVGAGQAVHARRGRSGPLDPVRAGYGFLGAQRWRASSWLSATVVVGSFN